jgi:DNA-binding transcriptional MerR regulator
MEFYTSDVTRITGVKRNTLQQWMDRHFIKPSIQEAEGSGSRNIFSEVDIHKIILFKKLIEAGLARKVASQCINADRFEKVIRKGRSAFISLASPDKKDNIFVAFFFPKADQQGSCTAELVEPEDFLDLDDDFVGVHCAFFFNFSDVIREVDSRRQKVEG